MFLKGLVVVIVAVFICEAAGFIGSVFTAQSVDSWYLSLRKPGFNPPNWVFAPVWTLLYALMGIAAGVVWLRWPHVSKIALVVFVVQLVLNVCWSAIFFGLRSPGAAFAEIVALWFAVAATTVLFWRISVIAGVLLIPYLLWVSFASVLNYSIWRLN